MSAKKSSSAKSSGGSKRAAKKKNAASSAAKQSPPAKTPKKRAAATKTASAGRKAKTTNKAPPKPVGGTKLAPSAKQPENELLVVGIGASAGGLEAFTDLLQHLPIDTGMAFVFVQHLDPRHKSNLPEILARSSEMPIAEVTDGLCLEGDHIYVVPANVDMAVLHGVLHLMPRPETRARYMPIDGFFRSLAEDQGAKAIGVILSGTGSDGALGLRAIKAEGGITMAQDQDSARYGGMPAAAVATGHVDFVLPPKVIAQELARIGRHPHVRLIQRAEAPEGVLAEPEAVQKVFIMLRRATGVDFTHYKRSTIERRISRRMVLHKIERLDHYVKYLQENPPEVNALFEDMLINVTGFFRDPATFDVLKKNVFPLVIRDKVPEAPIRVWVPGCSTGEEAYSIAIALLEFLGENEVQSPIQVFATDVSDAAIDKARAGKYPENIAADVSPGRLRRFFIGVESGYQISKTIRDMCVFAKQNVVKDPPFSQIDLLSCRNLLIYLGPELQKKVITAFHYALKPSGFLMLGTSETIGGFPELFSLVDRKQKIYSKKTAASRPPVDFAAGDWAPRGQAEAQKAPPAPLSAADLQRQADRYVLSRYAPSGVVIDEHLEILQFRGETGRYLAPSPGEASLNLLKMAREGLLLDLRATIHRVRKARVPSKTEGVKVKYNGRFLYVDVEVIPLGPAEAPEAHFLVLFDEPKTAAEPAAPQTPPKKAARKKQKAGEEAEQEIQRLSEELTSTKESLQAIIEDHEATNEELRAANEEIQSSNEELQSTNEELETAKEELQSTNEELTTLNEELENRNAELDLAINDLNNLLNSANIPIVMLDRDLRIRMFTPVAEKVLNIRPADTGRPIGELNLGIQGEDLEAQVAEVIRTLETKEQEIGAQTGRGYLMRIRPYKTADDKIEGAVLALIDTR